MNEELAGLLGVNLSKAKEEAFTKGLLGAIFQAASLSGPQRSPVGTAQGLGQIGLTALGGYESSMDKTLEQAIKGLQTRKLKEELDTSRRQQQALEDFAKARRGSVQSALANGGGPTVENAAKLDQNGIGGLSRDQLLDYALNPNMPVAERQLLLKAYEQTKPSDIQLPPTAMLYAQRMGYGTDPRRFTPQQASDIQTFIERPTIEQQVALGRFQFETGMGLPGAPTPARQPQEAAPSQEAPQAQRPGAPLPVSAIPMPSTPGLSPKAAQELRTKLAEAYPKALDSATYTLGQIKDTRDTAEKLLNDPEAIRAISGATGVLSRFLPGTKGYDAAQLIANLQSRNFVSEIQTMRQNNPTGGAVGNVAVAEMEGLSNIPATLKLGQSETQLKDQLQQLVRRSDAAINAITSSFERDYGNAAPLRSAVQRTVVETIPFAARDYLLRNPTLKDDFDKKYGEGSAARVLGGRK